ncbi:hypothetical protein PoB_006926700 [Plakobranchus ocellatus]|uniref:Uncharacterized protein n=1 Tax=Plakobranchus ocellatus TaxID=259542 RepID=A0AAV4DET2_9GAST|nr:hypothetical protein PoB_006926700 [Plakobranchus ocellatus]
MPWVIQCVFLAPAGLLSLSLLPQQSLMWLPGQLALTPLLSARPNPHHKEGKKPAETGEKMWMPQLEMLLFLVLNIQRSPLNLRRYQAKQGVWAYLNYGCICKHYASEAHGGINTMEEKLKYRKRSSPGLSAFGSCASLGQALDICVQGQSQAGENLDRKTIINIEKLSKWRNCKNLSSPLQKENNRIKVSLAPSEQNRPHKHKTEQHGINITVSGKENKDISRADGPVRSSGVDV